MKPSVLLAIAATKVSRPNEPLHPRTRKQWPHICQDRIIEIPSSAHPYACKQAITESSPRFAVEGPEDRHDARGKDVTSHPVFHDGCCPD